MVNYMTGLPQGYFGAGAPPPALTYSQPSPTLLPTQPAPVAPSLLGPTGQDRAFAFMQGLGAMAPGLIAAGAPSTDPGASQRAIAQALQARQSTNTGALNNIRAENVQNITLQMAQKKAALEQRAAQLEMQRRVNATNLIKKLAQGNNPLSAPNPQTQNPSSQRGNAIPAISPRMAAMLMNQEDPSAALLKFMDDNKIDPSKMFTPNGLLNPKGQVNLEERFRKELAPTFTDLRNVENKMQMVLSGLEDGSGSGEIQAVTSFIKMIDDGVVTEGELAVQRGAQSFVEDLRLFLESKQTGKVLGDVLKKNLARLAKGIRQTRYQTAQPLIDQTFASAKALGLRIDQINRGPENYLDVINEDLTASAISGTAPVSPTPKIDKSVSEKFNLPNK